MLILSAALAVPVAIAAAVPGTCAMYYNFTGATHSQAHFGRVTTNGVLEQVSCMGEQFDPQGQIHISNDGSGFVISTLDEARNLANVDAAPFAKPSSPTR